MLEFFTQPDLDFGPVSSTTGVFWLVLLAVGVYLVTRWQESNPLRYRFGRQVGIASIVLGALGIVLLALNLVEVAPFNIRAWIYLVGIVSLAFLGYVAYVWFNKLPAQVAAMRQSRTRPGVTAPNRSGRGGVRVYQANGAPTPPKEPREPRPVATTTRREARRDKKRKGR